jgi:hypothetical protein
MRTADTLLVAAANYVFGRHPFVFILAMIVAGAAGGMG